MRTTRRLLILFTACFALTTGSAQASAITANGYFDDPANTALLASDGYLDIQAARFGSNDEIARNIAVYLLTVTTGGSFTFDSFGFAAFGAEPYFTLFQGAGGGASFRDSNYSDPSIDFSLSVALLPGSYMMAIGVWMNMSFAENNPDATPTLSDGFTALGDPGRLATDYYEVQVSSFAGEFTVMPVGSGPVPVPEPASLALLSAGLAVLARQRRARRSRG